MTGRASPFASGGLACGVVASALMAGRQLLRRARGSASPSALLDRLLLVAAILAALPFMPTAAISGFALAQLAGIFTLPWMIARSLAFVWHRATSLGRWIRTGSWP